MPSTTSKNLGQIAAFIEGATPPTNTKLVWLDTSGEASIKKIYDPKTSSWIPLQSSSSSGESEGWGDQVIVHSDEFEGDGTEDSELKLAENGATVGQALRWNGNEWRPDDDPDITGLSEVTHTQELIGKGTTGEPLGMVKPPNPSTNDGYVLAWDSNLGRYSPKSMDAPQSFVRGMIIMWHTANSIPPGWVTCDGNNGVKINGITIPDMRGKMPAGFNASDVDFNSVNKTGGSKTVTQTIDQMPKHSHGINDPGHSHSYSAPLVYGFHPGGSGGYPRPNETNSGTTGTSKTNISISQSGDGQPMKTISPYNVLIFIIYVA